MSVGSPIPFSARSSRLAHGYQIWRVEASWEGNIFRDSPSPDRRDISVVLGMQASTVIIG